MGCLSRLVSAELEWVCLDPARILLRLLFGMYYILVSRGMEALPLASAACMLPRVRHVRTLSPMSKERSSL